LVGLEPCATKGDARRFSRPHHRFLHRQVHAAGRAGGAAGMSPPLVYVIGPSGVGKDSIMALARPACDPHGVAFAHRYITRPPQPGDENHIALSEAEFAARLRAGCFALAWRSHGLGYGIGREIDLWRASGALVVVNGSRAYLDEAAARYPELVPVLVTADP